MDEETFAIYTALWRKAENDGAFVHYIGFGDIGEAGYFHPRDESIGPEIAIVRPYTPHPDDVPSRSRNTDATRSAEELLSELCTLAHEYGHMLSWRAGERTPDYVIAMERLERDEPLSEQQKSLVREEERRAWLLGREQLGALGFTAWDVFDVAEADAHGRLFTRM